MSIASPASLSYESTGHSLDGALEQAVGHIRALTVTNFRSYAHCALSLGRAPIIVTGANGAGKTNLLEAVSMFSPGRGLRRAAREDLPRAGGRGDWAVSAVVGGDDIEDVRLGVGVMAADERRQMRIDGEPASAAARFAAHVRLLWLTPAQDGLFMGGPGDRRRFLDRITLARDATHADQSTAYERAMRQRNEALKRGVRDDSWLSALEAAMAEAGVAIAAARVETASSLGAALASQIDGPFPTCSLELVGELEERICTTAAGDVEDQYASTLKSNREADARAGRALHGPHRSDFTARFHETGVEARLCSTGEQKALLVSLILAQARLVAADDRGGPLVLLLDEIAAHFDDSRREALFDALLALERQVWMTGASRHDFEALSGKAQFLEICGGEARPA